MIDLRKNEIYSNEIVEDYYFIIPDIKDHKYFYIRNFILDNFGINIEKRIDTKYVSIDNDFVFTHVDNSCCAHYKFYSINELYYLYKKENSLYDKETIRFNN